MTKILNKFRKIGIFAIILGLLWQSSALTSILDVGHAKAGTTTITLNEFVSDSTQEWVELYNNTSSPIDLAGWKLTDLKTPASTPVEQDMLALSGTIPAHSVLAFDVSGLNNPQDSIGLYNGAVEVNRVTYGTITGYTANIAAPSTDLSGARLPDGIGGWYTNQTPTKGSINIDPLTVNAGGDKIENSLFTQDGTVTGGLAPYAYKWEQIAGPGTITFGTPNAEDTTITADIDGSYTVKFTATDQYTTSQYETMSLTWDTVAPTIDNIDLNQPTYNSVDFPQPITGNASDTTSEISKVEVKIKDTTASPAKFWNGSTWVTTTDTWNLASSTTSWSYQFDPANMTYGHNYEVKARAYDSLNQASTVVTKSFSYADNVVPTVVLSQNPTTPTNTNVTITAVIDGTGSDITKTKWAKGNQNTSYFTNNGIILINDEFIVDENDTYTVYAKDAYNNESVKTIDITNIDKTAPTGSIVINNGVKVTNSKNVDLSFPIDTAMEKNIDQMKITGDFKQVKTVNDGWETYSDKLTNRTLTDGNGLKNISVQFKDKAGNESIVYSTSIYYNEYANYVDHKIVNGSDGYTKNNIHLDINSGRERMLTYAEYSQNPEGKSSFTAFGKYFDLSLDSNETVSGLVLEISYTQADLDAMKITEDQITGLYYWNETISGWEIYPNQTIDTTDYDGYAGKIRVELDHLTPMVLGADNVAPTIPSNFKAEAKSGSVKLTWNKIDDADHYDIRYRKSTNNNDLVAYSEIYITTNTETEITNLENGIEYEFNIRAVDAADNKGEWAIVVATPNFTPEEIAKQTELKKQVAYYGSLATQNDQTQSTTNIGENNKDENGNEVIVDDGGEVKGTDNAEGETEGARTAVTLGIIIIAIGAALGGYYGYQWWLGEGENEVEEEKLPKETKSPEKPKNKKKKKSNRRW